MTGEWTLGIESTAHTFSFGLVDGSGKPYPSASDTIRPTEGGIHQEKRQTIMSNCRQCCFQRYWMTTI